MKNRGKSIAMTPVVMNKDVKQSVKAVSGTSKNREKGDKTCCSARGG